MKKIQALKARARDFTFKKKQFADLSKLENVFLYAGDIPPRKEYKEFIGLSLTQWGKYHIKHNVLDKYPLANESVDRYQSEDVFEHIERSRLPEVINEIYRILKKGGRFRLALPDYKCDILFERTLKDEKGNLLFDAVGGGNFINGKVLNGGHLWFPTYALVNEILEQTNFKNIQFLHYYDEAGNGVTNKIDYSLGYVMRTPDHDDRVKNPYRPMSIVVDCIK